MMLEGEDGREEGRMLDGDSEQIPLEPVLWPFEMGYLPDVFVQKALTDLNETEENKERSLKELREFVETEKLMVGIEFEDDFMVQFLRYDSYDVNEAFKRITRYVVFRRNYPYVFTDQRFDVAVKAVNADAMSYLPWRCQDGCAIIHLNLDNWYPSEFPVAHAKSTGVVVVLQALRDPMTQVNGIKVIFDARSNPWRHLRYCTFENLYFLYDGTQNCAPIRFQGIHVVNPSITFRFGLAIMMPFLSEEFRRKIFVHSSPEKLFDYFPKKVLPAVYGGDVTDFDMSEWLKRVMDPALLETMGGRFPSSKFCTIGAEPKDLVI